MQPIEYTEVNVKNKFVIHDKEVTRTNESENIKDQCVTNDNDITEKINENETVNEVKDAKCCFSSSNVKVSIEETDIDVDDVNNVDRICAVEGVKIPLIEWH